MKADKEGTGLAWVAFGSMWRAVQVWKDRSLSCGRT